ncbi:hypothetical protein D9757_014251 [Collybiopsis confluens]|uniref:G domain-containing protein n=1 Tax=Collybiopsis confluens TaxID=2823264 RepID=A0A8H5LIY5_9AGAR|nr:hypothetical protein D9757_014251 [Collybiopsis confluens]
MQLKTNITLDKYPDSLTSEKLTSPPSPPILRRVMGFGRKREAEAKLPNVVLFGSTGCGKSSVVNMLLDGNDRGVAPANVSSRATGCTFESKFYVAEIGGKDYKVWDTTGLNEGDEGTVANTEAFRQLCRLIKHLSYKSSGVSLLVFVMRGPRVTENNEKNFEVFFDGFCQKEVPIVIAVTGLENEEVIDQWWVDNKSAFDKRQMHFNGSACITATPGNYHKVLKCGVHEHVYRESIPKVQRLITQHCAEKGWKKKPNAWVTRCWKWTTKAFGPKPTHFNTGAEMTTAAINDILISLGSDDESSSGDEK